MRLPGPECNGAQRTNTGLGKARFTAGWASATRAVIAAASSTSAATRASHAGGGGGGDDDGAGGGVVPGPRAMVRRSYGRNARCRRPTTTTCATVHVCDGPTMAAVAVGLSERIGGPMIEGAAGSG